MIKANVARREHDLLIRGGTVVGPQVERTLDVAIDGEKIAALYEPGADVGAAETIDASGQLVIPGGIDPHVHYAMDFQGLLETEGPENTAAAVHGGNTTLIDFAIMEPPRGLQETITAKASAWKATWRSIGASTRSSPASSRSRTSRRSAT